MGTELLSREVQRQAEEERRYSLEKGWAAESPSGTIAAAPLSPAKSSRPQEPGTARSTDTFDGALHQCGSPSMTFAAPMDISSFRATGAIFATRFSRRSSPTYAPPCGARTSIPDRHMTPGPGTYEYDTRRAMTSILNVTADQPQPAFRSRTNRFGGHLETFDGADPIHLYPGAQTVRDTSAWAQPSPTTFRRGKGQISFPAAP